MSLMSRRSFYMGAAAALSAARVLGANDRIRVGVVGLGGRGSDHLRKFLAFDGVQVAGLCDVYQAARDRSQAAIAKKGAEKATEFNDMRDLYASRSIDAVSIATPNHWHALAGIWAVQAGKDVYLEKPASHNIHESYRLMDVVRSSKQVVQVGQQSRSESHKIHAMQLLKDGVIGSVYVAKGLCFKRRKSIGKTPTEPPPTGLDWSLFLGPAQMKEYSKNRFAYNWHWFWDTGNGDIGNQGIHEMDICRWALDDAPLPQTVVSTGGKFVYDDDQETPNTQYASFLYPDKREIMFEVRGLLTGPEAGLPVRAGNTVGDIVFGSEGWMWIDSDGFQVYKGEKSELVQEGKRAEHEDGTIEHMRNFFDVCRSRDTSKLRCPVTVGATSVILCHMANISYRTGHLLKWDDSAHRFVGDDAANALATRNYRKPFVV